MSRNLLLRAAVAVLVTAAPALGVTPIPHNQSPPLTSFPCDAASHPCNFCTSYSMNEALQIEGSTRSMRSNDSPDPLFGTCSGTHMWCKVAPQLQPATYSTLRIGSQPWIRINVGYDFPNNYCLVWDVGDSCHASNWPTPPGTHLTRLQLLEGANTIYDVPAIFENGTWMPTIAASCDGSNHTYTIRATNSDGFADCVNPTSVTTTVVVTFPDSSSPACHSPDLRPCPGCAPGGDL